MQKGVLKIGDTKQFATPKALDFIKNENDPQKDVLVVLDNVIKMLRIKYIKCYII